MRRAHRVFRAQPETRGLYVRAFWLVLKKRIQLTIGGRRLAHSARALCEDSQSTMPHQTIATAITKASKLVPGASCLTQALAADVLLKQNGYNSEIRIGVKSEKTSALSAHAWVVCDGQIVLGGTEDEIKEYSLLTKLHSAES